MDKGDVTLQWNINDHIKDGIFPFIKAWMDLGHIIGLPWWISGKATCNAGDRLKSLNNLIIPNTFLLRGNF